MAGLHGPFPREIRILDPGAGLGILTAAVCDRIRSLKAPRRVNVTVFETDPLLWSPLEENLRTCQRELRQAGHEMDYELHREDFIAAAAPLFSGPCLFDESGLGGGFTTVIMNPPYFKVRRESPHARLLDSIIHGQPNAYAFFMALGAVLLTRDGELLAITPRSFCNGLYFRAFRQWLLDRLPLRHLHLFESRTDVFRDADVLQESVITRWSVHPTDDERITVSSSVGKELGPETGSTVCRAGEIVDKSDRQWTIRIPVSEEDRGALKTVEGLPTRFSETGLRISTGPVVAFRATEFLVDEAQRAGSVPLLWPHNVRPFSVQWPLHRRNKPESIAHCDASRKLLIQTRNCVVLKRFSSKEERRRLTAGCLLRSCFETEWLGLENHLNYVYHETRELTEEEVFGIAAVFNSRLFDQYFRIISGNTQINATEIRGLPFPSLVVLGEIGAAILDLSFLNMETDENVDSVVRNMFSFDELVPGELVGAAD